MSDMLRSQVMFTVPLIAPPAVRIWLGFETHLPPASENAGSAEAVPAKASEAAVTAAAASRESRRRSEVGAVFVMAGASRRHAPGDSDPGDGRGQPRPSCVR